MENKKAKNRDEAWEMQEMYTDKPHGWVQWKGTDVCMDVHCKCGHHSHIDVDFAYFVKCPKCGTVYMCNGHIELIEVEQEPENCVITPELDEDNNNIIKCESCGNNNGTSELHSCPYYLEMNDDNKPYCNCCKDCCNNCAADI